MTTTVAVSLPRPEKPSCWAPDTSFGADFRGFMAAFLWLMVIIFFLRDKKKGNSMAYLWFSYIKKDNVYVCVWETPAIATQVFKREAGDCGELSNADPCAYFNYPLRLHFLPLFPTAAVSIRWKLMCQHSVMYVERRQRSCPYWHNWCLRTTWPV